MRSADTLLARPRPNAPTRGVPPFADAAAIVLAMAMSGTLFWISPAAALLPFVALGGAALLRSIGVGRLVPRTWVGWLIAMTLLVVTIAPSLGALGTIARLGAAALVAVTCLGVSRIQNTRMPRAAIVALTALLVALVASMIAAPNSTFGLVRLLNWVMFIPLMVLAYRRPDPRGPGFGIVVAAAVQMVGVALQWAGLFGGTWGGLLLYGQGYDPNSAGWLRRYTGFVLNPNDLALILVLAIVTIAASFTASMSLQMKVLLTGTCSVFIVGIVLSGSRGGLLALAIGLLVVCIARGARGWIVGVFAVAVAVAVFGNVNSQGLQRVAGSIADIVSGHDSSSNQRSATWALYIEGIAPSNLLLGRGFGGYAADGINVSAGLNLDPSVARRITVDNAWLKLLLESGIVAVAALAYLMLSSIYSGLVRARSGAKAVGVAAGASLIVIIWRSLTVDILDLNPWNAVVFLALGLGFAAARSTGTTSSGVSSGVREKQPLRERHAKSDCVPSPEVVTATDRDS